jgi:hypothetical protein
MKQKLVGTYWLDDFCVRLFLREGEDGAEFDTCPKKGETMRLRIGADYTRFDYVTGLLMHETLEALLAMGNHRFQCSSNRSWSGDRYIFHLDHAQFAEIAAKAGEFFHDCFADFKKAWYSWKRDSTKKPKPKKKKRRKNE